MKLLLPLVLFAFSISSFAAFDVLLKEFQNKNFGLEEAFAKKNISELELQQALSSKPWFLNYNYSDSDSALSAMPASIPIPPYTTASHVVTIGKDFDWGGSVGLSNHLMNYDGAIATNGFSQTFTYKQQLGDNFFGRMDRRQNELAKIKAEMSDKSYLISKDQEHLMFLNTYRACSASKLILELQAENFERAKIRTNTVKTRVRDGLSLKVELIQTQMAENGASEAFTSADNRMNECLKDLESKLHRPVSADEISSLKLEFHKSSVDLEKLNENQNLVSIRKSQIGLATKGKELATYSIIPKVEVSVSYKTNAYEDTASSALSSGNLASDSNETIFAVNLAWPIFSTPQRLASEIAGINLMLASKKDQMDEIDFNRNMNFLKQKVVNLDSQLESVDKRVAMAREALKEYNSLYTLGKADIDLLLRAEETLIATQQGFAQNIIEQQLLESTLAFQTGTLENYIKELRD